jgi:transcriptional regulator with XRE-family HTH domain
MRWTPEEVRRRRLLWGATQPGGGTQEELAAAIKRFQQARGVTGPRVGSRRSVSQWERGVVKPSSDFLDALDHVLGGPEFEDQRVQLESEKVRADAGRRHGLDPELWGLLDGQDPDAADEQARLLAEHLTRSGVDEGSVRLDDADFVATINHLIDLYEGAQRAGIRVDRRPLPADYLADHDIIAGPRLSADAPADSADIEEQTH